jgi:hypothetical protein
MWFPHNHAYKSISTVRNWQYRKTFRGDCRDLYHATSAVTRDLCFSGLIRRTAPFSRLLPQAKGTEDLFQTGTSQGKRCKHFVIGHYRWEYKPSLYIFTHNLNPHLSVWGTGQHCPHLYQLLPITLTRTSSDGRYRYLWKFSTSVFTLYHMDTVQCR